MKVFHCDHCGQLLFFENVRCVRCGRTLAYVPELADMVSLDPVTPGDASPQVAGQTAAHATWRTPVAPGALKLCDNYTTHAVCNWALAAGDADVLCVACRLTRTIPNLSRPENRLLWYKLEVAKRRLVYTLLELQLPLCSKSENESTGLAFDFLEDTPEAKVMTGHAGGVITLNLAEADDAERVKRRIALKEPYRTLLGHFRHESGHYYWDRLVRGSDRLDEFRVLFGDEREDYQAALQRHYERGAPPDFQNRYVSAYATMHPWEDWAETWAHYLHMTDALETAAACGIAIVPRRRNEPRLTSVPNPVDATPPFERMIDGWGTITYVLNNLNRGLGNDDAYPFVLSTVAVEKLRFVHETIAANRGGNASA